MIKWAGRTYFNYQLAPKESEHPAFLMALDESTVLDVAFSSCGLAKNPIKSAIATASQLAVMIQKHLLSLISPQKGIEVQIFQSDHQNQSRKYCPAY